MTREQIAAKIAEQMTRKGSVPTSDKKDYLWKPPIGKASIRVLPSKYFRKELFAELLVHFEIGNKSMMCLTNFGEKDPIVEFIQQLRKTPEWQSANKLEPKNRIFLPIIVRGEEDKGVRLWEFGKQIFLDLLRNMDDEDLNDITDPINGHDVTIDTTSPDQNGTKFNQSAIKVRAKSTRLSDDSAKISEWLENQPDPRTRYNRYSYEEMVEVLKKHLTPEEAPAKEAAEDESPIAEGVKAPEASKTPENGYKLNTASEPKPKKTAETKSSKEIDDLFKI